jgi:hypothetical protein
MPSFAPGTPKSVMDEFNKKFYGSKQSQVDESPPQAEPAKGGKPVSKPLPKPPTKPKPPPLPPPRPPVSLPTDRPMPPTKPPVDRPGMAVQTKAPPMPMGAMNTPPSMGRNPTGGMFQTPRMKAGGSVGSASKRGDGIAQRGKTKGRML